MSNDYSVGNVVYHELTVLDADKSRLDGYAQDYDQVAFNVDVSSATSIENLVEMLHYMAKQNLHFVGSRGLVYTSHKQSEIVLKLAERHEQGIFVSDSYNLLTRAGGLRETCVRLLIEEVGDAH